MKAFVVVVVLAALTLLAQSQAAVNSSLKGLTFKAAYQGERLSDAFSSIFYAGGGVVLAGKRSNTAGHRIYRSTDHGRTWSTTPEPSGYSGKHVYFFDKNSNTGVILTGTGDTGSPVMLRSKDDGKTWSVVLTAAQAKSLAGTDAGAIFSPLWLQDSNHWIACLRNTASGKSHIIESKDDGSTWTSVDTTGLHAGCRRMILTSYGHILCAGVFADSGYNPGLYLSQNKGRSWVKVIDDIMAFAGMEELPKGIYLAGTMNYKSNIPNKIVKSKRSNNRVTVTLKESLSGISDGTCVGIASMSDSSMNVHQCAKISVINSKSFSYANSGADVAEHSESNAVFLPPDPCAIYRSTDAGASWEKVATLPVYSMMTYVREIRYLGNGLVYAFLAANENEWDDRALAVYRSTDSGKTWNLVQDEIYVGKYGRLNSVYQTALTDSNILVAATQPDSDIIIHEGSFS